MEMKEKQIMKAAGETTGKVYEGTLTPKLAMYWAVPCIGNLVKPE